MTVKEIYGTDFPIILAPMAGITDLPFRILCKEQGADVMVTEMISAKALFYGNKNTLPLMQTEEEEKPIGVQIFGSEPELMGEMAHKIEDKGFSYIDINMGCPVPKIVNNKEGSALMLNSELAGRIVKEVSKAVSLPVTVKFRKALMLIISMRRNLLRLWKKMVQRQLPFTEGQESNIIQGRQTGTSFVM
nr:tRNA-dihydrouridine synthase family protein [Anaerobutyricum hallii]